MSKIYTVDQIRKYLEKQDSLGDVLYNLTEEKIDKAQIPDRYYCVDCEHEQESDEECKKCGSSHMEKEQ